MEEYAPIALFAYNRPLHLKRMLDALRNNRYASESMLYVFSDGPGNKDAGCDVLEVRKLLKSVVGFKKVMVVERDRNFGLSRSIIDGVGEIVSKYGRAIVLEDDLVTSPFFLKFMNDALAMYQDDERVISVCGYMYPVGKSLAETYFLRIADCWGWATWKRGWDLFEPDAGRLLGDLRARKMTGRFDLSRAHDYSGMLKDQSKKNISSWAIRWYASALLRGKLSLYPSISLVGNIGFDGMGTHCPPGTGYDGPVGQTEIEVKKIPVEEDARMIKRVEMFLRAGKMKKMGRRILDMLRPCKREA